MNKTIYVLQCLVVVLAILGACILPFYVVFMVAMQKGFWSLITMFLIGLGITLYINLFKLIQNNL